MVFGLFGSRKKSPVKPNGANGAASSDVRRVSRDEAHPPIEAPQARVNGVHRVNGAQIDDVPAPDINEDVPLCWSGPERTRRGGADAQFDDLLPPLIVAALSGRPIRRETYRSSQERMVAGATIGPSYLGATLHLWGVGIEGDRPSRDRRPVGFRMPRDADWIVHAVRGPYTAAMLREAGVPAPDIFGDPFWFAPRVLRFNASPMRYELGVVPPPGYRPMTALQKAANRRWEVPRDLRNTIDIIDLECAQTSDSIANVARRLGRCRRLLVANPRLLALGEALGVPVALIGRGSGGVMRQRIDDDYIAIPAEARDIYGGLNAERMIVSRSLASEPTPWEDVIRDMDELWEPVPFDPRPLFEAFPMSISASLEAERWPLPRSANALGERRDGNGGSPLAVASRIAESLSGTRPAPRPTRGDAKSVIAAKRAAVKEQRARRLGSSVGPAFGPRKGDND